MNSEPENEDSGNNMLIGEIQGAVSTKGFVFTAYQEVKKFDFVAIKRKDQWILAQIDEVTKFPEGVTEADTIIIGFREGGLLKRPRYVLKPKSMVYQADQATISETLGVPTSGLYIGRVETNRDISIYIDPKELFKHLAILAKTGAGKSYLTAVIIEEILENKYPVLIIDPHGEYSSLSVENELTADEKSSFGIKPKAYPVQTYSPDVELNRESSLLRFSSKNID